MKLCDATRITHRRGSSFGCLMCTLLRPVESPSLCGPACLSCIPVLSCICVSAVPTSAACRYQGTQRLAACLIVPLPANLPSPWVCGEATSCLRPPSPAVSTWGPSLRASRTAASGRSWPPPPASSLAWRTSAPCTTASPWAARCRPTSCQPASQAGSMTERPAEEEAAASTGAKVAAGTLVGR